MRCSQVSKEIFKGRQAVQFKRMPRVHTCL